MRRLCLLFCCELRLNHVFLLPTPRVDVSLPLMLVDGVRELDGLGFSAQTQMLGADSSVLAVWEFAETRLPCRRRGCWVPADRARGHPRRHGLPSF